MYGRLGCTCTVLTCTKLKILIVPVPARKVPASVHSCKPRVQRTQYPRVELRKGDAGGGSLAAAPRRGGAGDAQGQRHFGPGPLC